MSRLTWPTLVIGFLLMLLWLRDQHRPRPVPQPVPERITTELRGCWDGDTCTFTAWDTSVRFARIDTPELDGPCPAAAELALHLAEGMLRRADIIRIDSVDTGYYGRIIAEVWADDRNVSTELLASGLAAEYGNDPCPTFD